MNFFEHQDKAKKHTKLLTFYFILAVICIVLAINAVVYAGFYVAALDSPNLKTVFRYPLWLYITPVVLIGILLGSLFKWLTLAAGGKAVAKLVGARPLSTATKDFKEQQFIHVVEEMAIASGVSIPKLYVMDEEWGINAFVAGINPEDTVMVVTKGALDHLTRSELQGVVGHEFSHIFNADMRINVRLIAILAGLLMIGKTGYLFLRSHGSGVRHSRRGGGLPLIVLGLGLMLVGSIGVFFGRLIKAAISRQRELLADACAVQYTRNPESLVHAFYKILRSKEGTRLLHKNAEDVSHLCFCESIRFAFNSMMATHPPLLKRIALLDPHGQYKPENQVAKSTKTPEKEVKKEKGLSGQQAMGLAIGGAVLSAQAIQSSIARPQPEHYDYTGKMMSQIPQQVRHIVHQPQQVGMIFYALMLIGLKNDDVTGILQGLTDNEVIEATRAVQQQLRLLPEEHYVPIIELTIPAFVELPESKRLHILDVLEKLVQYIQPMPFHLVMLVMAKKRAFESTRAKVKDKYTSLKPLEKDIFYLVALIIENGHMSDEEKAKAFDQTIKQLLQKQATMPSLREFKPLKFEASLLRLNQLQPPQKEQLINALIEVALYDQEIKPKESALLKAIAECLDTPLPPVVAHSNQEDT